MAFLLHDDTLERCSSGPTGTMSAGEYEAIATGDVEQYTLEELQRVDVGAWKGAQFGGERLISFADALDILPPGKSYLVELKNGDQRIIPCVQVR